MSGDDERRGEVRSYLVGYAGAIVMTGVAFAVVHWPIAPPKVTFAAVLALAFAQILLQFRYFLHISFKRSSRDDLQLILFSTLVVALMVGGTLVILMNLRERMM